MEDLPAPSNMFAEYRPRALGEPSAVLPSGIVVRPARIGDREALAALTFERQGGVYWQHRERIERELEMLTTSTTALLLIAAHNGTSMGFGRVRYFEPAPDAPLHTAPTGFYLAGVIVSPEHRRRGIGAVLTERRLEWIAERASEAFYFAGAQNRVTIDLHSRFGFVEVTRDFVFPNVSFTGGVGVLFRIDLTQQRQQK